MHGEVNAEALDSDRFTHKSKHYSIIFWNVSMLNSADYAPGEYKIQGDGNLDNFLQRLLRFQDIQCIAISIFGEDYIPEISGPILNNPKEFIKLR